MINVNQSTVCRIIREYPSIASEFKKHGFHAEVTQCEIYDGLGLHMSLRMQAGTRALDCIRATPELAGSIKQLLPGAVIDNKSEQAAIQDIELPNNTGWTNMRLSSSFLTDVIDIHNGIARVTCINRKLLE